MKGQRHARETPEKRQRNASEAPAKRQRKAHLLGEVVVPWVVGCPGRCPWSKVGRHGDSGQQVAAGAGAHVAAAGVDWRAGVLVGVRQRHAGREGKREDREERETREGGR